MYFFKVDPNQLNINIKVCRSASKRKMWCFMAPYLCHLTMLSSAFVAARFHYCCHLWWWHFISVLAAPASEGQLLLCQGDRRRWLGPAMSSPSRQGAANLNITEWQRKDKSSCFLYLTGQMKALWGHNVWTGMWMLSSTEWWMLPLKDT